MEPDHSRSGAIRAARWVAAVVALVVLLVVASTAAAAPSVTFSLRALPIPKHLLDPQHGGTWPHTGDMAGARTELEARFAIQGTEDAGLPNPLRSVVVYLPKGLTVHRSSFATCPTPVRMTSTGLPRCPKNSFAGAVTAQQDTLNLGETPLPEPVMQGALFSTGDTLNFWSQSTTQEGIGVEGLYKGRLQRISGSYGYRLSESFSYLYILKNIVLNSPSLSTDAITVALGAARQQAGHLISYLTMPKRCPASGLPVKSELTFGREEAPASWETVITTARLRCGGRKAKGHTTTAHASRIPSKRVSKGSTKCNLKTKWLFEGSYLGPNPKVFEQKEFSAALKILSSREPKTWPGATVAVEVKVHNPKITICRVAIGVAVTGSKAKEYHVTIGPHGGQSSSVTLPSNGFDGELEVFARMPVTSHSGPKGAHR